MAVFKLSIMSPQGKAFEGDAESYSAPGREGEFGVLAHHAPMLAMLKPGISKVVAAGSTSFFVTGEGYCEVTSDSVNVLVDCATKTASLDEAKTSLAAYIATICTNA